MFRFSGLSSCYLFICLMAFVAFSQNNGQLLQNYNDEDIGDVTLYSETMLSDSRGVARSFNISVPKGGRYFVGFVTNGAEGTEYSVYVDDQRMVEGKVILAEGWSSRIVVDRTNLTTPKAIPLGKGDHAIVFFGEGPEVPFIERIRIAKTEVGARVSARDLIAETQRLSAQSLPPDYLEKKTAEEAAPISRTSAPSDPRYKYDGFIDVTCKYSYFWHMDITNPGQTITFETKNSTVDPVLYIFYEGIPNLYSWSNDDGGSGYESKISFIIPMPGPYIGVVRSYYNESTGTTNIYRNGTKIASSVQVSGTHLYCGSNCSTDYVNFFTSKPGNNPVGNKTYDTRLFVMQGLTSPIFMYNNDYTTAGDYKWGTLSRIRGWFPNNPTQCLIMHRLPGYSTTVDVYAKCFLGTEALGSDFPKLKEDDAIKSSDATSDYNCISWSGGRTDLGRYFWPPDQGCPNNVWYDTRGSKKSFDNFFGNVNQQGNSTPRSSGMGSDGQTHCYTYIPTFWWPNSRVDLWATGSNDYTHASVLKPADNWMHGYDWESKAGGNIRFFHPRNALRDGLYGKVVAYYQVSSTNAITEAVDAVKGEILPSDKVIDEVDNNKLSDLYDAIPQNVKMRFNTLYRAWEKTWSSSELFMSSNPTLFFKSNEYHTLAEFCKRNETAPLLLMKCRNGDELAGKAIYEMELLDDIKAVMEKTRLQSPQGQLSADGRLFIDTGRSAWARFVKNVLAQYYK